MMGRRMRVVVAGTAVLMAIGLAGCKTDNTPKEYNSLTQQNFLELCTNHYYDNTDDSLVQTSSTIKSNLETPTQDQCLCQYDVFVNQVPINKSDASKPNYSGPNFTDLNAKLKTDPQGGWDSLPSSVKDAVSGCMSAAPVNSSTTSTTLATENTTTTAAN